MLKYKKKILVYRGRCSNIEQNAEIQKKMFIYRTRCSNIENDDHIQNMLKCRTRCSNVEQDVQNLINEIFF